MKLLRRISGTNRRCLQKFIFNFLWKGFLGFRKFKKRKKRGEHFPAFQFISVTDACNLSCKGCWIKQGGKSKNMDLAMVRKIIEEGKAQGSYFYGILGGEPFMYKDLFRVFEEFPDCYFQLFTNGTLLNGEGAAELQQMGNVTPLISFEGDANVADIRRGGKDVFYKAMEAIDHCTRYKLVTGVAISVCKSNIDMALSDEFVEMLWNKGVVYLWYYIYRPTGPDPCYELALDPEDITRLRRFMVEGRSKYSLVLVDSYWDADGKPFCPAAEGLSHHINPYGYVEPCPVIQFATDRVDEQPMHDLYENSGFLKDFKASILEKTNGCVLMEDPAWVAHMAQKHAAENTSGRKEMPEQLQQAPALISHGSVPVIPEKNSIYRFVKKQAFFGIGAYG